MNTIFTLLTGLFTGKAGEQIGGAVSVAAQVAALVAAIGPVALWLAGHKDETFITLTYGDLAFWGAFFGGQLFLIVRLVHRAPAPN